MEAVIDEIARGDGGRIGKVKINIGKSKYNSRCN